MNVPLITKGKAEDGSDLTSLIAEEIACFPFFTFALQMDSTGVVLDVRAPADARDVIDDLLA